MNITIEKLYERILQHIILIALCVIFVPLTILITIQIASVLPDFLTKNLILAVGGALGFIISFVLFHYIFTLFKQHIFLKSIIYLASIVITSLIIKYTIIIFYSIPYEIRIIFLFLILALSYELYLQFYKLLTKTKFFNENNDIKKTITGGNSGE